MLPAAFRNAFKSTYRYSTEGVNTLRGDPIMGDLSPGLTAAQFFGFAPAEYVRNQERNQVLKGIDRAVNERRTKLLKKLYVEMRMGGDTNDVMDEINKFNKRHPQFAIDGKSVRSSMKKHEETSENMYHGVLFSPSMRDFLLMMGEDFGF